MLTIFRRGKSPTQRTVLSSLGPSLSKSGRLARSITAQTPTTGVIAAAAWADGYAVQSQIWQPGSNGLRIALTVIGVVFLALGLVVSLYALAVAVVLLIAAVLQRPQQGSLSVTFARRSG